MICLNVWIFFFFQFAAIFLFLFFSLIRFQFNLSCPLIVMLQQWWQLIIRRSRTITTTPTKLVIKQVPVYSAVTRVTAGNPLCFFFPRQDKFPPFNFCSEEEFAAWSSTSLLHEERCCLSLGTRFITASKQKCCEEGEKKNKTTKPFGGLWRRCCINTRWQTLKKAQSKQRARRADSGDKGSHEGHWYCLIAHY